MAESKDAYRPTGSSVEELLRSLSFIFSRISDRLDAIEGHRGRPDFYTNPRIQNATASRILQADADSDIESTDLSNWVSGETNNVTITDNGDGTVTITALISGDYFYMHNWETNHTS